MSISGIDASAKAAKTAFVYLLAALACALFGAVYECFSHGVYSYFMLYAFAFPLVGGTLPFLGLHLLRPDCCPGPLAQQLYHCGIATLTVGSILRGILEIYGTTNTLASYFWPMGLLLTLAGLFIFVVRGRKKG